VGRPPRRPDIDWDAVDYRRSDAENARELGVSRITVSSHRRARGLPARIANTSVSAEEMAAREAEAQPHLAAMTLSELSARFGVSGTTARKWRRQAGLPSLCPKRPPPAMLDGTTTEADLLRLAREGDVGAQQAYLFGLRRRYGVTRAALARLLGRPYHHLTVWETRQGRVPAGIWEALIRLGDPEDPEHQRLLAAGGRPHVERLGGGRPAPRPPGVEATKAPATAEAPGRPVRLPMAFWARVSWALSDKRLAKLTGYSASQVARIRERLQSGRPTGGAVAVARGPRKRRYTALDATRQAALPLLGTMSDNAVGREVGCNPKTAKGWREELGIARWVKPYEPREPISQPILDAAEWLTVNELGPLLGASRQYAHQLRQKGLIPARTHPEPPSIAAFVAAWQLATTVEDVARLLGVSASDVAEWGRILQDRWAQVATDHHAKARTRGERFAEVWNASATVAEAAERLQMTSQQASRMARYLRLKWGTGLKYHSRGNELAARTLRRQARLKRQKA